jgi:hypothetical protein
MHENILDRNCFIRIFSGGQRPSQSLVFQFLRVVAALANFSNETIFTSNDAVLASFDAGQTPFVIAQVPSIQAYTLQATISGHMINFP